MEKRLKRGDVGVNKLDAACREHDIIYAKHLKGPERKEADKVLASEAWKRVKAKDASFGERAAALAVAGVMKAKSKLGLGLKKNKPKTVKKKKNLSTFRSIVEKTKQSLKGKQPETVDKAIEIALSAAKVSAKNKKKSGISSIPRVIPVPKIGGVLPVIPIFAALSALGALMGGSASVANAVMSSKNAKNNLTETTRHNETMEAIALGKDKSGNGLYLRPYKTGLGIYYTKTAKKKKCRQGITKKNSKCTQSFIEVAT